MKLTAITPAAARLLIAADVVQLIASGSLNPETNAIFGEQLQDNLYAASRSDSAQAFLKKTVQAKQCTVCAKGALFVGHTLRFNKKTIGDARNFSGNDSNEGLEEFPPAMLAEIETLFEREAFGWNCDYLSDNEAYPLAEWSAKNLPDDAEKRLLAILGMLIQHGGEYVKIRPKKARKAKVAA